MSDSAKAKRLSKGAVIVIDDDEPEQPIEKSMKKEVKEEVCHDEQTSENPTEKSVKREVEEEPVPSSEVELQQKVIKLEEKLQRAYRAAGEYKERAEAAESRLDSKYGIKEGLNDEKKRADLEMRLAEATSQLEDASRRTENVLTANAELKQENAVLKEEMSRVRRERKIPSGPLNKDGVASMDGLLTIPPYLKKEKVEPKEEPIGIAQSIPSENKQDR